MKEQIITTAKRLFIDLGVKGVTMDDLASKLGISKKTVYQHFPNKKKLVDSVCTRLFEEVKTEICSIQSKNKNPIDEMIDIHLFLREHLKIEHSSPLYQLKKYYPEIKKKLDQRRDEEMTYCIENNLNRGKRLGVYREDFNTTLISQYYKVVMDSIQEQKFIGSENFAISKMIWGFLNYHFHAIATEEGLKKIAENKKILSP